MTTYSDAAKAYAATANHFHPWTSGTQCDAAAGFDAGAASVAPKCICGTPGLDYDGPDEECPIHGGPGPTERVPPARPAFSREPTPFEIIYTALHAKCGICGVEREGHHHGVHAERGPHDWQPGKGQS